MRKLPYQLVKDKLLNDVKNMTPHTRLPSRIALVEAYSASRSAVEKAISELIGEKILYAKNGSGTYVSADAFSSSVLFNQKTVAIILPDIATDTYPEILRGIMDECSSHGINIMMCNTDNDVKKQNNYISNLINSGISGAIIIPAITDEEQSSHISLLEQNGIPFVFAIRHIQGFNKPHVSCNNFYGAYQLTKHLIDYGHKKFAFIAGGYYIGVEERYHGFLTALHEYNITLDENMVIFGDKSIGGKANGYNHTLSLLKSDELPDAIVCFNDSIAEGAFDALTENGLTVGDDIALTGYDDTYICEKLPVKLTTVRFPKYEVGKRSASILYSLIQGETYIYNTPSHLLHPKTIIRQSSGIKIN